MNSKLGFCEICGESLWQGIDHSCEKPIAVANRNNMSSFEINMLRAIILADLKFSGIEKPEDSGRAEAAIKRILWKFQLTQSEISIYSLQTSTEACPPCSWDEI